jgi:hypothetical protein
MMTIIGGGGADEVPLGDIHYFNPDTREWTAVWGSIGSRTHHRAAVLDQNIVIVDGVSEHECKVALINTAWWHTLKCTELGNAPFSIAHFAFASTKAGLLALGGTHGTERVPWQCAWLLNADASLLDTAGPRLRPGNSMLLVRNASRFGLRLEQSFTAGEMPKRMMSMTTFKMETNEAEDASLDAS